MQRSLPQRVRKYKKEHLRRKRWQRVMTALACVVVFCTTYALILPAITMTAETYCGIEEHTHIPEECYERVLICGYAEDGEAETAHQHTEACYETKRVLLCGQEEQQPHTHSAECYRKLICGQEEQAAHTHGAECYARTLTCGQEEQQPHTHSAECYVRESSLTCGQEERAAHTHDAECYVREISLTCGQERNSEHTHSESCYTETERLACALPETEGHTHSESCYTETERLACTLPEAEGHTHSESCYTEGLVCGLAETEGHTHSESCYTATDEPACGLAETEGHIHGDDCYQEESVLICLKPTPAPTADEATEPASEESATAEPAESHVHTDECYEETLICEKEEHTHSLICYSNPEADVENASIWERTLPQSLGSNWAENVVAVAKSQLGYKESTANYIVMEDGVTIKGYTRYGAWYRSSYEGWCAMFASFCLHYAGVPSTAIPYDANCNHWVGQLKEVGLYERAEDCIPEPGFLIFFDNDGDGRADHVGIVTEVAASDDSVSIKTVEGNTCDEVAERSYTAGDKNLLGYGVLPKNPDAQSDDTESESAINAISDTVPDLTSYLTRADIMVDGNRYVEGQTLPASKEFSVSLGFSNIPGKNGQTVYTYTLPSQVTLPQNVTDGVLTDATGTQRGTYTIIKNAAGKDVITIKLDETYVADNDYLSVNLEMSAKWNVDNSGEHKIDFGNDLVTKVTVDTDTKLAIDKTHTPTGKRSADYSIVVEAVTAQSNVQLSDSVTQSYTDSDGNPIGATLKVGGTIKVVWTNASGNVKNSDTRTIEDQSTLTNYLSWLSSQNLSMAAGDTLTITYPMEFSESAVYTADANGLTLKTTNTATVSSAEVTEALSASEQWGYYGKKSNIIQKTGEMVGDNNDSLRWDLTMNYGGNLSMVGGVVYDQLQSEKLSYDTSKPFVVEVYNGSSFVTTITINDWSSNGYGLKLVNGGRGWEYTIPKLTDDGKEQYTYKISYYTTVMNYDGTALNNAAGARFSQYPPIGIIGQATQIDIGIVKLGELKKSDASDSNTVQWTIKYTVYPGSGVISNFRIADYLPSYRDQSGATRYAVLVDKNGNTLAIGTDITTASHKGNAFIIKVADYKTGSDYTANDSFAFLKNYQAYYNSEANFAISDSENGFTLPAAVGDYKNGYAITVAYLTQSPGIALGEVMDNRADGLFSDLSGNTKTISANAKVGLNTEDIENSVTLDKTGIYDADAETVHYTVKVDTENVGFRGASTVTITDTFDSRLSFNANSYDLTLSLGGASTSGTITLKEQSSTNIVTTKVTNPDGTTTWKTKFPSTQLYAEGQGSTLVPVEVWTTVDNTNHTFSVYLPYLYTYGITLDDLAPVTYQLDYYLTPSGTDRVYTDVSNTVRAVGDNNVVYGSAKTTFSFGQNITSKTLTDAEKHQHTQSECYTYDFSKGQQVLTCPLTETVTNEVRFKVRVDFGANELKTMTQLTIDDYMDTNKLPPDLSKVQLQFVGRIPSGEQIALSFADVCELAGTTGSYTTELTSTGLSVNINLGCTVKAFIEGFYNNTSVASLAGGNVNLGKWKLELSYPAAVKGNVGETVRVTNWANLRGVSNSSSEVGYDKVVQGSSGSVSGQSYTLDLKKIDAQITDGTVKYLSGATFALYDRNGGKLAEATTDADGTARFGSHGAAGAGYCDLVSYTAYYLMETAAPTGYVKDTTKYWFYFTAPAGTAEQQAFTEEQKAALEALGCVPMEMDGSIQIANSQTASFKIKKVDDKTGETLTGAEFRLYSDIACQNEVQVARTSGDGIYLLDGLRPSTTYYLKETIAPTGYEKDETVHTVTLDADGSVTIEDAAASKMLEWEDTTLAYIYKNSKASYVLPETGGAGTLLFTIGGTLLLAGSLLYGYALRRKRERRSAR